MKRIIMVLAVAALMAVMMVAMAAPAFATKSFPKGEGNCGENGSSMDPVVPGVDFLTFPNLNAGGNLQGLQLHSCPANSPVGLQ